MKSRQLGHDGIKDDDIFCFVLVIHAKADGHQQFCHTCVYICAYNKDDTK